MSDETTFFSYPHNAACFFNEQERAVVTMSCRRNMLCAQRQLTRKTLVWCGVASNAVIAGQLICEKQEAAGATILGMKLILMNRIEVLLLSKALGR